MFKYCIFVDTWYETIYFLFKLVISSTNFIQDEVRVNIKSGATAMTDQSGRCFCCKWYHKNTQGSGWIGYHLVAWHLNHQNLNVDVIFLFLIFDLHSSVWTPLGQEPDCLNSAKVVVQMKFGYLFWAQHRHYLRFMKNLVISLKIQTRVKIQTLRYI